jgi:hypothetical protein
LASTLTATTNSIWRSPGPARSRCRSNVFTRLLPRRELRTLASYVEALGGRFRLPLREAAVTAPLIAPVIPSSAIPRRRGHGVPGRLVTRLPLVGSPEGPPAPSDLIYGIGRIDASGRVADRTITGALDWRAGDRLTLTTDATQATGTPPPSATSPTACSAASTTTANRPALRRGNRIPGQATTKTAA